NAMKEYTTSVDIRATLEAVWAILTDGPGYAQWNPEITRVDGRIALGEKIKAHVVLHGGKVQPVSVRVTALEPTKLMEWTGGFAPRSVHRPAHLHAHSARRRCRPVHNESALQRAALISHREIVR